MEAHLEPQAAQQGCEGIHQQEAIAFFCGRINGYQGIDLDLKTGNRLQLGAPVVSIEIEYPLNIDNIWQYRGVRLVQKLGLCQNNCSIIGQLGLGDGSLTLITNHSIPVSVIIWYQYQLIFLPQPTLSWLNFTAPYRSSLNPSRHVKCPPRPFATRLTLSSKHSGGKGRRNCRSKFS